LGLGKAADSDETGKQWGIEGGSLKGASSLFLSTLLVCGKQGVCQLSGLKRFFDESK